MRIDIDQADVPISFNEVIYNNNYRQYSMNRNNPATPSYGYNQIILELYFKCLCIHYNLQRLSGLINSTNCITT